MSKDWLVRRGEGLVEAEVDGEIVALHIDNGTCYGFNQTATAVWKLLEQPRHLNEVCEELSGEYEVDREECERDVLALLRDLEADGLVAIEETTSPA